MTTELTNEIERLKSILASHGIEFKPCDGARPADIKKVEDEVGIQFDSDLKDFWQFTNGSGREKWSAVVSDQLTPCRFISVAEGREYWSWFLPYDKGVYEEWSADSPNRDERIRPDILHHRLWFPIAEFNGFSTSVYFDADPSEKGKYGQIIVYQHDPDAVYYLADNFLDFFKRSNDMLSTVKKEDLA